MKLFLGDHICMSDQLFHWKFLLAGFGLMSLVFMIEKYTGSLVGTVAYIFIALGFLWLLRKSRYLVFFGVFATLFMVAPFLFFVKSMEQNPAIVINRIISMAVVWSAVYFVYRFNKLDTEQTDNTNRLNALFENANEGILFADENGLIIKTNPFLDKMLGYAAGELLNRNLQLLIPDHYAMKHVEHMKNYVQKPGGRHKGRELLGQE